MFLDGLGELREKYEGARKVFTHPCLDNPKAPDSSTDPQPRCPGSLKAFSNAFVAEEQFAETQRASQVRERLKSACTHTDVRPAVPRIRDRPHKVLPSLPPYRRQCPRECRASTRAHLYSRVRHVVVDFGGRGLSELPQGGQRAELCRILQTDFGEHTFHAVP